MKPRFLAEFELVWLRWSARTNKPLPFRSSGNVFDVSAVAVSSRLLYSVLGMAVGTLNKKPCFLHGKLGSASKNSELHFSKLLQICDSHFNINRYELQYGEAGRFTKTILESELNTVGPPCLLTSVARTHTILPLYRCGRSRENAG